MGSPRHATDSSLMAVMGEAPRPRKPMKPRHDEPQVNVNPDLPKAPKSSSKKKNKKHATAIDEMDEASKEAHIVQKIEMAIKKSRSERKASSHHNNNNKHHHHHHGNSSNNDSSSGRKNPNTPAQHRRQWSDGSEEGMDENYQIINKTGDHHHHRSRPKRTTSNTTKVKRHKAKPPLEAPATENNNKKNRYKSSLIDLDDRMDELTEMDGLVDDKRGFQIDVDQAWLSTTFSDPTLDTYENNHFLGQDKRALAIIDPQRIQCGPAKSAGQSSSGKESDPVTSIIDRIYEKKEQPGNTYPRKKDKKETDYNKEDAPKTGEALSKQVPNELISFDNYEDDDGYYYEDDEDEYPIYPSSRPPPPRPATMPDLTQHIPLNMKFPSLMPPFQTGSSNKRDTKRGDTAVEGLDANVLQSQVNEINQLHRDIQRQQDLIKQVSQLSAKDHNIMNPHETSADVYHRELARQAQAELYRLELVQKSMMLEKQMEIYRRNQEEWNKVRDMAIKEEESRRKIVEKAKEVWQAEMRERLGDIGETTRRKSNRGLSAIEEKDQESRDESGHSTVDGPSPSTEEPSLYQKIADLNNRAQITEEDQKIIEAEILKELHMELSKQAAEKKVLQKPKFFSEKMRNSWSGKQPVSSDPNKPVEQVTEELAQKIYELNLEMAPSNKLTLRKGKSRRARDEGQESGKHNKGVFMGGKSRTKDHKHPPRHRDEDDEDRTDDEEEDYDSHPRSSKSDPVPSAKKKKKKALLRALGLRKHKGNRDLPMRGSAEINTPPKQPKPISRTLTDMVSPKSVKNTKTYEFEAEDYILNTKSRAPESERSETSSEQFPSSQRLPTATSSQSTPLTSNKVYIGVQVDGDAIEAMSFSSKNALSDSSSINKDDIAPALSKDSSCESRDRYTTCSGEEVVTSGSKQNRAAKEAAATKKKAVEDDEPSIFEFLEVQYYPHDDLEAPLDEIEADAHRSHH